MYESTIIRVFKDHFSKTMSMFLKLKYETEGQVAANSI